MATSTKSCRLCGSVADYKHCVALFSTLNVKSNLPGRISKLLAVPDIQNDGRSTVICRGCMRKFAAVERDLETLRQNVKKVYESYNKENESRKRTKDTSGDVNVSPHTAAVRPPAKRLGRCRTLFPTCEL